MKNAFCVFFLLFFPATEYRCFKQGALVFFGVLFLGLQDELCFSLNVGMVQRHFYQSYTSSVGVALLSKLSGYEYDLHQVLDIENLFEIVAHTTLACIPVLNALIGLF